MIEIEVEECQQEIYKAIVEYDTSDGLKRKSFESINKIDSDVYDSERLFYISEIVEGVRKTLMIINLQSLVSFRVEKIKED